jgi:hypothetical protein
VLPRASNRTEVIGMAANPIGTTTDEDVNKGVVEDDPQNGKRGDSQESMGGQLGHRSNNPDPNVDSMVKDNDTDFPEPDAMEEHTGEEGS